MREKELIIYRNTIRKEENLLSDMVYLMEQEKAPFCDEKELHMLFYKCVHKLLALAAEYGFYGNLWHCYLAHLLVNDENSYSLACEMTGEAEGGINRAALHDIGIFREFFAYDFMQAARRFGADSWALVENYENGTESKVYHAQVRKRICELAGKLRKDRTPEEMKETLEQFYKEYGVGKFGLHKAFRIVSGKEGTEIVPITDLEQVHLNDLVGYEIQKKKLVDNTEAFVQNRKANNCLLFGDAGTGKSSSIKAIANEYYGKGLRIIEIYKHQFRELNDVIGQLKNRNYKFIIYMDDLSFEEFETDYKYLKAVIEGGLEKRPENVLIYATSNRRHLVREKASDKNDRDEDLHTNDTVQEKLSLSYRFGVTIYFGKPEPKEFRNIVRTLAKRYDITMDEEMLLSEANKWELSHGGLSGRTARQFIDYLLGKIDSSEQNVDI